MAALEKQGLLEKAHTSSGRMPSVTGFQYYVKHSLAFDRLAENEVYEIVKAFDQEFFKLEDILQEAANLLTDLSDCTVVALDVEPSRQRLTAFDIVVFGTTYSLGSIYPRRVPNGYQSISDSRNFLQEDLNRLKTLIQERFLGHTVLDIHYKRFGRRFRKLSNVTLQQRIMSWISLNTFLKKCSTKTLWCRARSIS